jgi:hypothetical protein
LAFTGDRERSLPPNLGGSKMASNYQELLRKIQVRRLIKLADPTTTERLKIFVADLERQLAAEK